MLRKLTLGFGWFAIIWCSLAAIFAGYTYVTTGRNLQLFWCLLNCALVALNISTIKDIYKKKGTNEQN